METGGGGGKHMGRGDGSPDKDRFNPEVAGSMSGAGLLELVLGACRSGRPWWRCAWEAMWKLVSPALSLRKSKGCMFWSLLRGDSPGLLPMPGRELMAPLDGGSFMKLREFLWCGDMFWRSPAKSAGLNCCVEEDRVDLGGGEGGRRPRCWVGCVGGFCSR